MMFLMVAVVLMIPHIVAMVSTQRTLSPRSSGLFRWFPQAKDVGEIPLSYHVLKSPALDFAPWLELHHVVLLGAPGSSKVFAVDYSPLNQNVDGTVFKLFKGLSVPAEIRVRMIDANSVSDIQDIKRKWTCMGTDKATSNDENVDGKVVTMEELTMMAKEDENLRVVRDLIDRIYRKWSCSMNLYTHNCQHFSHFVGDLLTYERVCSVDVQADEIAVSTKMAASVTTVTVGETVSI